MGLAPTRRPTHKRCGTSGIGYLWLGKAGWEICPSQIFFPLKKLNFLNFLGLGIRRKMGIEEEGSNDPKSLMLNGVTGGDIGTEEQ